MPKGAQREPNCIERVPKGSQRAIKMTPKIDVRKRSRKRCSRGVQCIKFWSHLATLFHQKCIEKSMLKSVPKKTLKLMKSSATSSPSFVRFQIALPRKSWFSEKAPYTETIVFMQQNACRRGFAERGGNQKREKHQCRNQYKNNEQIQFSEKVECVQITCFMQQNACRRGFSDPGGNQTNE